MSDDIIEPVKDTDGVAAGAKGMRRSGSQSDLFGSSDSLSKLGEPKANEESQSLIREVYSGTTSAGSPTLPKDTQLDDREDAMLGAAWRVIEDEAFPAQITGGPFESIDSIEPLSLLLTCGRRTRHEFAHAGMQYEPHMR